MQRIDLRLPLLQIQVAIAGIGVILLAQVLDRLVERRPLAQLVEHGRGDHIGRLVERIAHGHGQDHLVHRVADNVPQRGRADDRQVHIGPGSDAIIAQRVGQAIIPVRQVEGLAPRHVEQPQEAQRRIDAEAPRRLRRLAGLQLQHIGRKDDRLAQVREEIAQPLAHRPGQALVIGLGHRLDHRLVDGLHRLEALGVQLLQRITRRRALLARDDDVLHRLLGIRCGQFYRRRCRRGHWLRSGRRADHGRRRRFVLRHSAHHHHSCGDGRQQHRISPAGPPLALLLSRPVPAAMSAIM